jgi:hypothetical protein
MVLNSTICVVYEQVEQGSTLPLPVYTLAAIFTANPHAI